MDLSDFFICYNPFYEYDVIVEAHFYHDAKPRFFASMLCVDPTLPLADIDYGGDNTPFLYIYPDGRMKLYIVLVEQLFDRAQSKLPGALQRAALWYCSFLNSGDKVNKGKGSSWSLLDNYNALTPGLQLINFDDQKKFMLSYPGGIKTFNDRQEIDRFMNVTLGYPDVKLARGRVNMIGLEGPSRK